MTGVALGVFSFFDFQSALLFFFLGLVICGTGFLSFTSNKSLFFIVGIILIAGGAGILRWQMAENKLAGGENLAIDEKVTLVGEVVREPDVRQTQTRLIVETENGTRYLVLASLYLKVKYGDQVEATGKVKPIENFDSGETDRTFNYIGFMKVQKVLAQMSFAQVKKVEGFSTQDLSPVVKSKRWLIDLKKMFVNKAGEVIREPEASLLAGLLFGDRRGLGSEWENIFRRAGLIHIVVLSGYNMAIVAIFIMAILSWFFSRKFAIWAGVLGIIIFAIMVSGGPTVVRASIMAIIAILARGAGRPYVAGRGLLLAGFLMVLWNPFVIVYDPGFQLSFIATAGLIYLAPFVEKFLPLGNWIWGFKEIVVTTVSAQLSVLPWLIYQIGEVSLVSLPANILVLPAVPFTMLIGFLASFLGLFSQTLGLLFGLVDYFLLSFILFVARSLGGLPVATVTVPPVPLTLVLVTYLLLTLGIIYLNSKNPDEISTKL